MITFIPLTPAPLSQFYFDSDHIIIPKSVIKIKGSSNYEEKTKVYWNSGEIKITQNSFIDHLRLPEKGTPFSVVFFCASAINEIQDAIKDRGEKLEKLRSFLYNVDCKKVIFLVHQLNQSNPLTEENAEQTEKLHTELSSNCSKKDKEIFEKHKHKIFAHCITSQKYQAISERNHFVMIAPLRQKDVSWAQIWMEQHDENDKKLLNKAVYRDNAWGFPAWTQMSKITQECLGKDSASWKELSTELVDSEM